MRSSTFTPLGHVQRVTGLRASGVIHAPFSVRTGGVCVVTPPVAVRWDKRFVVAHRPATDLLRDAVRPRVRPAGTEWMVRARPVLAQRRSWDGAKRQVQGDGAQRPGCSGSAPFAK